MVIFLGKDPAFKVVFYIASQDYTVYKNDVVITKKNRYRDIKPYLQ